MIWNLDPAWLLVAIAAVSIASYLLGYFFNTLLPVDGFGTFGNMLVFTTGFFGAIYTANYNYIRLDDLKLAIFYGGAGALGLFLVLLILHAFVRRIF